MHANLQDKTWYGDGVPVGVMDNPVPRGGLYVNLGSGFAYVNNGTLESPNYVQAFGGGDIPDPLELGAAVFADSVEVGLGTWHAVGVFGSSEIDLTSDLVGHGSITASGIGAEIQIRAGDGDEVQTGGEIVIQSGGSDGNNGGDLTIQAGSDSAEGDGGNVTVRSGHTADGAGGELTLRAGNGLIGGDGGQVLLQGGNALADGAGGDVLVQGGGSASGSDGSATLMEGGGNHYVEVGPTGIFTSNRLGPDLPTSNPGAGWLYMVDGAAVAAEITAGAKYVLMGYAP